MRKMAYQELDEYIAAQIAQGVDAGTIKRALLEAGWFQVDVDNALRDVAADAVPTAAVSLRDDVVRMRHAVVSLDQRVRRLEGRLAAAPEATLPPGTIGPDHELPAPHPRTFRGVLVMCVLAAAFVVIGYAGMASIFQESITPAARIWAEVIIGGVMTGAGFIAGRMHRRGAANLLTGTGLAFAALATVGAWYVNYVNVGVAAALGGLLVTLALVLGRFYDTWAARGPWPARTA